MASMHTGLGPSPNKPSAITTLLDATIVPKTPQNSIAIQTLHNLQYQHFWTDLQLHTSRPSAASSPSATPQRQLSPTREPLSISSNGLVPLSVPMISGRPPKPLYIHPDIQAYMIQNEIDERDIPVEVEWVLPTSIGEKWSLKRFAEVFEYLPEREYLDWVNTDQKLATDSDSGQKKENAADEAGNSQKGMNSSSGPRRRYRDAKRVVLSMLAHAGMGGDGTLSYYIMQEGDVKPRQN